MFSHFALLIDAQGAVGELEDLSGIAAAVERGIRLAGHTHPVSPFSLSFSASMFLARKSRLFKAGMVRSAAVPHVYPPVDLRPFIQGKVPEPGLDITAHGSVDTDVPEPRLHIAAYGSLDVDVSKPGVDIALYASLDQNVAPGSGDLLDAFSFLDNPISHDPIFGSVSGVG